jgi:hypothetical protein
VKQAQEAAQSRSKPWPRQSPDPASAGFEEMLRSAHIAQSPAKIPLSRRTILQMLRKNHCEDGALC